MTPDVQAAAERLRKWTNFLSDLLPDGTPQLAEVPVGDLRIVLAALDPAETPTDHIPTRKGLDYLAIRQEQHPKGPIDA